MPRRAPHPQLQPSDEFPGRPKSPGHRGGVHILFAGEKVRPDDEHTLPNINESERAVEFQVANLEYEDAQAQATAAGAAPGFGKAALVQPVMLERVQVYQGSE
jgi:hypothetical protein